jgi:hypothetical protein
VKSIVFDGRHHHLQSIGQIKKLSFIIHRLNNNRDCRDDAIETSLLKSGLSLGHGSD